VITSEQARSERRGRRESDLGRLARTDMLNLHSDFAYWDPPAPARPAEPTPPDLDDAPSPSPSSGEG